MAETGSTQAVLLSRLAKTLDGEKASATFACGGTCSHRLLDKDYEDIIASTAPILFYEDKKGECHKVSFPASAEEMETLASHCDLATFGVGNEERLDTEYRSAWKLDNTKFATSFHPFDSDIIEVIRHLLFPGAVNTHIAEPVVVAELYKLNIYKGPHDKFKPHVDTPRSEHQFGSLVVCLPCAHTGGELAVRHDGREVKFDWSKDSNSVQWAAFYSDCEHEVLPVTSGYRVTLTYNLYYNIRGGQLAYCSGFTDTTPPLYQVFAEILQTKHFMPTGGVIGIYCHHDYAHASKAPDARVLAFMKGTDAAMLAVCRALGLQTQARPVYLVNNREISYGKKRQKLDANSLFLKKTGSQAAPDSLPGSFIGDKFRIVKEHHYMGDQEDSLMDRLEGVKWVKEYKGITWINQLKFREANHAYITYGNEPGIGMLYSAAALFILVPKWDAKRGVGPVNGSP